jgi:hypothetical protein
MKTLAILAIAAGFLTLTSTASTDKYGDLLAQGFRWSSVHGLYACVSKDDVRLMLNNPSDKLLLKMVEQVKAYFLTTGALVQVTEEDPHLGLSKIRVAGITVELWTLTKFSQQAPHKRYLWSGRNSRDVPTDTHSRDGSQPRSDATRRVQPVPYSGHERTSRPKPNSRHWHA